MLSTSKHKNQTPNPPEPPIPTEVQFKKSGIKIVAPSQPVNNERTLGLPSWNA